VIAEGIETEEQYQQLRLLGCEFGQGFLFSQPVDGKSVLHLLAQDARRDVESPITLTPQQPEDDVTLIYSM
jgi:sensor c-di-GMP phosphodiesterase-like protein